MQPRDVEAVPSRGIALTPPPPDRIRDRLRRRLLAMLGTRVGLNHWLMTRGTVLLAGFIALYLLNGLVIGWKTAYDVTIGITSPGDRSISVPALAWALSAAGWLAAPAIFGAVAGVVIGAAVNHRRTQSIGDVLTKRGSDQ
ncbi:DUF6313 family protein [Cryptosporangium arvum]|uniref:DUF6313 family protein n=1 Tax=Cryptosporangium arvum TaxID=80871 RepID=UPI0012EE2720|nr:DUF6313 family protein [Cryptosporangium arvum]